MMNKWDSSNENRFGLSNSELACLIYLWGEGGGGFAAHTRNVVVSLIKKGLVVDCNSPLRMEIDLKKNLWQDESMLTEAGEELVEKYLNQPVLKNNTWI
jgi:hypothetical protein